MDRFHRDYHACDLLSDVLSRGNSSRLFNRLVKEKRIFSDINAYITGDMDEGLFVVTGKVSDGVPLQEADATITQELEKMCSAVIGERELEKVKNKTESTLVFSEMSIMNKALNLAIAELMGDAEGVNNEAGKYRAVTASQVQEVASSIFKPSNCSTLHYRAIQR